MGTDKQGLVWAFVKAAVAMNPRLRRDFFKSMLKIKTYSLVIPFQMRANKGMIRRRQGSGRFLRGLGRGRFGRGRWVSSRPPLEHQAYVEAQRFRILETLYQTPVVEQQKGHLLGLIPHVEANLG